MKRSNGKYRLSTTDAISNAQEQYTRCAAVCPGTFTPVQGDLKVVKAGLQGQLVMRVPRGRQPGRFKSRESGVARGSRPLAGARGTLSGGQCVGSRKNSFFLFFVCRRRRHTKNRT